jgi:hypothetical protein
MPTNKADPVKSAAPKGQRLFKASAAITKKKQLCLHASEVNDVNQDFLG